MIAKHIHILFTVLLYLACSPNNAHATPEDSKAGQSSPTATTKDLQSSSEPLVFAGDLITLQRPEWLLQISEDQFSKLYPGKDYRANYHETSDQNLIFYSEMKRDTKGKSLQEIHKANEGFIQDALEPDFKWNRREIISISGTSISLLDYNVIGPTGARVILLTGISSGKSSVTTIIIKNKEAEKLYVDKLYAWLEQS